MTDKKSNSFLFGLTTGIAITALLGFLAVTIATSLRTESSQAEPAPEVAINDNDPTPTAPTPSAKVDIEIKDTDHIRGDKNAPVTIVEYSDFQCPYCAKFHKTLNQVMKNYKGEVNWVYRHFPLDFHEYARSAAEASECAADQNKFWEYNDALFKNQADIDEEIFAKLAKDLKLDVGKFNKCLDSGKYTDKVESDYQSGVDIEVAGTPGAFINGTRLKGAVPYAELEGEIEELLK